MVLYKRFAAILECPSLGTTIEGFYSFFGLPFASSSVLSIEAVGMKNARSANLRASSMALFKWLAFAGIGHKGRTTYMIGRLINMTAFHSLRSRGMTLNRLCKNGM